MSGVHAILGSLPHLLVSFRGSASVMEIHWPLWHLVCPLWNLRFAHLQYVCLFSAMERSPLVSCDHTVRLGCPGENQPEWRLSHSARYLHLRYSLLGHSYCSLDVAARGNHVPRGLRKIETDCLAFYRRRNRIGILFDQVPRETVQIRNGGHLGCFTSGNHSWANKLKNNALLE